MKTKQKIFFAKIIYKFIRIFFPEKIKVKRNNIEYGGNLITKKEFDLLTSLEFQSFREINGVVSIFTGPGFLTLTKEESADWKTINTDILNKFDTM